jgi:hypothetical protein
LVSDQVGVASVEYLRSIPHLELASEKKLSIRFAPAINSLSLKVSPPVISLLDTAELILQLVDSAGKPIAADAARYLSLAIESGIGEIDARQLSIPSGQFEGRTKFNPTWWGTVAISAATPNLLTQTVALKVTVPFVSLALSSFGGLVGGLLAFLLKPRAKWWRIVVGLVTGFLLYWAFVFGVLSLLPRGVVLNPLSTVIVSLLGGWLGSEVFTIVMKRLRLGL